MRWGAALAGAVFIVYALGACPTIYVGDSGELVTAVHLLGIPHPTGYPLYVLLGKAWTLLVPAGSVAWRMSLFSAFWGAAACGVLYGLCRASNVHPIAAAFSGLLLAFSPSFWSQATVQRVYTLGALFVLLATAMAWRWHRRREHGPSRDLALAFFLCGLGATNHAFMALYAVALGLFALVSEPSLLRRPLRQMTLVGALGVGLLPYLYLPLRSRANPRLDWGDPETVQGFLEVVLRRDFWERAWVEAPADLGPIVWDYARSFGAELTWFGAALVLVGIVAGWRRGWPVLLPLLVMAANLLALSLHGSRSDLFIWHRYYIPSYSLAALLAGIGCHVLIDRLPRAVRLVPLAVPAVLLATGWQAFDRSRYRIAEDFASSVLESLPPGAHLSATDDNILFALMYLHLVEGRRPDVNLVLQGVGKADLPALRFDPDTEPLFFTHHPNWNVPGLRVVPVGVVFRTVRAGRAIPPPVIPRTQLHGESDPRVPKDYLTQNLIGHLHYMLGATFEEHDWLRARGEFEAAARAARGNDVLFYNLGLIFRRNGLIEDAIAAFERSAEINPRHLASRDRPRATDRLAEVRAEQERLAAMERGLSADPSLREVPPGTPAFHRRLARLLDGKGEPVAARGHRLRALELEKQAGESEPGP